MATDLKQIEQLVLELEKVNKEIVAAGGNTDKLVSSFTQLNKTAQELGKTINIDAEATNKLNAARKEAESIEKRLVQTEAKLNEQRSSQSAKLRELQAIQQRQLQLLKAEAKAKTALRGSNEQLAAKVSLYEKRLSKVNQSTDKGKKAAELYKKEIDRLNTKLTEQSSTLTQTKRNIGNYKDGMKDALSEQEAFGFSIKKVTAMFSSAAGIAGALGAAVIGLGKAYASSARGAEDMARASDRLSVITKSLGNSLADATGDAGFFDLLLGGIQQQIVGVANTIDTNVQVAILSQIRQLDILDLDQERQKKKQLDRAEVLRQVRDDDTKTFDERIAANNELGDVVTKRELETIAFQEKKLRLFQTLLRFDEGNLELQRNIKQIEFEIADASEEAQGFRSEQLVNVNTLIREQKDLLVATGEAEAKVVKEAEKRRTKLANELVKIELQKNDEINRLALAEVAAVDAAIEAELAAMQDAEDKEIEAEKNKYEILNELREADLEKTQEAEDKKREAREQAFGQSVELANVLFDFRLNKLDAEFEAAEGNEKKQAEIRTKQAQIEKKQALFNIAIGTAEGIIKTIANVGFPLAIPLIALTGAIGLAQSISVASRPIPQFAKGTSSSPSGLAELAEQGSEMVKERSGKIWMAENRGLYNLKQGSTVLTASQTQKELNDKNIVNELRGVKRAINRQPRGRSDSRFDARQKGFREGYMAAKHRLN